MFALIATKRLSTDAITRPLGNSYYIEYNDRTAYCTNVNAQLDQTLQNQNNANAKLVKRVWLSPSDDNYFASLSGDAAEWVACQSFSNDRLCDRWMSPRNILYTNDSISQEFSCGRSVHEVANDLERGTLQAQDIPCMDVFEPRGATYGLNNRRLWALLEAETDETPIKHVDPPGRILSKLRNGFQGTDVRLR